MLPDTMHAIRLNAPHDFEYVEVPRPAPRDHEVLCRVEAVSICGTDPHIIAGDFPGVWPKAFPLIPGHEWAGTVVALGEKSELFGWKIGDRVCGIANAGCGYCRFCRAGLFPLCENAGRAEVHSMYGHSTAGAYAEYIAVSIKSIEKIPDSMSFETGTLMDAMSIALHMVMRCGVEPGDSVLVNGAGAQGWMSILCARAMGAETILCTGSGARLAYAASLGAVPIDYHAGNVVDEVMRLTGGKGVKRVMECTGTAQGVNAACYCASTGGAIAAVGFPPGEVPIPIKRLVMNEIAFLGSRANPGTLDKAIRLALRYESELSRMITHAFPLSRYAEAYETFTKRRDGALKVVLHPQEK